MGKGDDTRVTGADERAVIDSLYAATADPTQLSEFELAWERYVDALSTDAGAAKADGEGAIQAHIAQAIGLIERLSETEARVTRAQALVDATPEAALLVDARRRLAAANTDAARWMAQLAPGQPAHILSGVTLRLTPPADARLGAFLSELSTRAGSATPYIVLDAGLGTGGAPEWLLVTALSLRGSADSPPQPMALITSITRGADAPTAAAIREAFDLTPTEAEITRMLVAGMNAREIAERRDTRKTTLDKQIKQIRHKLGARSMAELVQTVSLALAKERAVDTQIRRITPRSTDAVGTQRRRMVLLRDGRRASVVEQGHPKGRPVFMSHTALGIGLLSPAGARQAVLRGYRMILPWRPGFDSSDAVSYRDVPHMLDVVSDDLRDILDALDVPSALLCGARVGQHFAIRHPDRARALMGLTTTSVWRDAYLDHHKGRRRTMLKTSIHSPGAVRFLARLGYVILRSGRPDIFTRGLYKDNPVETKVMEDPEILRTLVEANKAMATQSPDAYVWEVALRHHDMSDTLCDLHVPVGLLSGEAVDYFRPEKITHYRERLPNVPFVSTVVPDAGATLLWTHADALFDMLDELDALAAA